VPIDRVGVLRNAEKLIRQGKLDAGITEYVRLVDDNPNDWNARNTLGDLYARVGRTDKAIEQFVAIGTHLVDDGMHAKATAILKKILKLKPDHEHALTQLAEVLTRQKLYADARTHFNALVELRRSRGDKRGVLEARVRIGSLDPGDYEARMAAASARVELGDVAAALAELKTIANELIANGRDGEAVDALSEAATIAPADQDLRQKLFDAFSATGNFTRAREYASTVEQFRTLAAALEARGENDAALDTLRDAANAHSGDTQLKSELARKYLERGDVESASRYLTLDGAGADIDLLLSVARMQLCGDGVEQGIAIVQRLLNDPSTREKVGLLGWTVAEQQPETGFRVVELAADSAVAQNDWAAAAAVLQEFVTRVPNHIPALMRLVEICVDGGLEATMYSAQAQLADAYIAGGYATEARFISEDLVAREPWDKANIERFRRALVLLGEPDPDGLIAQRLSGESPFMSTDLFANEFAVDEPLVTSPPAPPPPPVRPAAPPPPPPTPAAAPAPTAERMVARAEEPAPKKPTPKQGGDRGQFELSPNAIELDGILRDFEAPGPAKPAKARAASDDVEVDLRVVVDKPSAPASEDPEKEYKRALSLRKAGDVDNAIRAFEQASKSPRLRFLSARAIGQMYRDRGQMTEALEWLERASQAPTPTADDSYSALYELADALEAIGETARALAVFIELQADAGEYRDVDVRVDRLTRVQTGG